MIKYSNRDKSELDHRWISFGPGFIQYLYKKAWTRQYTMSSPCLQMIKLFQVVKCQTSGDKQQKDLTEWNVGAKSWQTSYSVGECKITHVAKII